MGKAASAAAEAPDADAPGAAFADAVAELLRAAGAAEIRYLAPEVLGARVVRDHAVTGDTRTVPEGWDLADALAEGWTPALVTAVLPELGELPVYQPAGDRAAAAERQRSAATGTPGFKVDSEGVFHRVETDDGSEWRWLCSRLDVLAKTRGTDGANWGRLLEWHDADGRKHVWSMPAELLAAVDGAEYRRALTSRGLDIAPGRAARDALHVYLTTAKTDVRARCVDRSGWHPTPAGSVFVLGEDVLGTPGPERIVYQGGTLAPRVTGGTLAEWQAEVAARCAGNSRLVFAVSAAFAAPLLTPAGAEGGGVHFVGGSSTGKTTALLAAASVFGLPVAAWRATANGLEGVACAHNDLCLMLDELSQCDPREAGASAYLLANGTGKSRARQDGSARPARTWRLLFLSSGEVTLADKLREDGRDRRPLAGQAVRLLEVPADAGAGRGLFEDLHGAASPGAFADALRDAAAACTGTAGPAFITHLARDVEGARGAVRLVRDRFRAEYLTADADGQVRRAADRFALIAAGGGLAASLGIVQWPPETALAAAGQCFIAWLGARGGTEPAEVLNGIRHLRDFIAAHGESRFSPWDEGRGDGRPTLNRVGFRKGGEGPDAGWFVFPESWGEVCGPSSDPRGVAAALATRGWLITDGDGKTARRVSLPGMGQKRAYHVATRIMGDGE